jgi:hypothetical protein
MRPPAGEVFVRCEERTSNNLRALERLSDKAPCQRTNRQDTGALGTLAALEDSFWQFKTRQASHVASRDLVSFPLPKSAPDAAACWVAWADVCETP